MLKVTQSFASFVDKNAKKSKICNLLLSFRGKEDAGDYITVGEINYLTNRNAHTISYLPEGKEHKITVSGKWALEGRQDGKPSRVIRKIMTPKFLALVKDKDFEDFANLYKAHQLQTKFTFNETFNIVDNYCGNYASRGSLGSSCMNDAENLVSFYEMDCMPVALITCKNKTTGELEGRALLWTLDDGSKFMDRVYTSEDYIEEYFISYAIDKGYYYKKRINSYEEATKWVSPEGTVVNKEVIINIPSVHRLATYVPYLDTFSFIGKDKIANYHFDGARMEARCSSGGINYLEKVCELTGSTQNLKRIDFGEYENLHYDWHLVELTANGGLN